MSIADKVSVKMERRTLEDTIMLLIGLVVEWYLKLKPVKWQNLLPKQVFLLETVSELVSAGIEGIDGNA